MVKVSVIIPTYNRSYMLERAIDSVLNQTLKDIEVIVVDDNGENTSQQLENEKKLHKYCTNDIIKYIKHKKNMNGAAARNTGISQSNGEYITFLDDDDVFYPNRLEILYNTLENNRDFDAAYSSTAYVKNNCIFSILNADKSGNLKLDILKQNSFFGTGSNMFFRADVIKKIGLFDVDFLRHQDLEYMVRFFDFGKILNINKLLVAKCVDDTQNTPNYEKAMKMKIHFLDKFKQDINLYSEDVQKEIYFSNFYGLYMSLQDNRVKNELIKYGTLSILDYLKLFLKNLRRKIHFLENIRLLILKMKYKQENIEISNLNLLQYNVGCIQNQYPEKRFILNYLLGKYNYKIYSCKRNLVYIFKKFLYKLNITNYWDSVSYYKINSKKINCFHTINTVLDTKNDWIVTFETMVPRTNFAISRPWNNNSLVLDNLTKRELYLLSRDNCKSIIAMSKNAYNIEKKFIMSLDIDSNLKNKVLNKLTYYLPPQKLNIDIEQIAEKFKDIKELRFIFVGKLFFRKGGASVIRVLKRLEDKFKFKLTIVSTLEYGDDASYSSYLDFKQYKNIIDETAWIEYYSELNNNVVLELMKESHVGLLPTIADTFGFSILEMQASGLPVVSTDIRAIPEINNNDIGYIVNLNKDLDNEALYQTKSDYEQNILLLEQQLEEIFIKIFEDFNNGNLIKKAKNSFLNIKINHNFENYEKFLRIQYSGEEL